ncbi:glycosyltransferase family 2 protein [Rhodococcus opacus]
MNETSSPVISVITVNYNDHDGLVETTESLTKQRDCTYEHVIVDGGSTDGSADFIDEYRKRDSRVVAVSEPDDGIFDAMNKGIRMASGDVVVFMNAGDLFTGDDTLSFVASDYQSVGWDWAYGCLRYMSEEGEVFGATVQAPFLQRRFHMGFRFVPHQATYLRLEFIRALGGFDVDFGVACDQELAMRASLRSAPRVWVRFMSDFRVGGVHTDISFFEREDLWHRMRVKNGVAIGDSSKLDRLASSAVAVGRTARSYAGSVLRRA